MASQDLDQPKIESPSQQLSSHGRDEPVCSVDDFLNSLDRDLEQVFVTHEPIHPASQSGMEALVQPRSWSPDDLDDGLIPRSATEPLDPIVTGSVSNSEHVEEEEETVEDWNSKLTVMIRQMMFVSGETSEASVETTTIIEEIVHTQVTEIVSFTMLPFRNKLIKP